MKGDDITDETKKMSARDSEVANRELMDEFREKHLEWWREQRDAVAAKNATLAKDKDVDAFAHYDTTDKPVLCKWVNAITLKKFTAHLFLGEERKAVKKRVGEKTLVVVGTSQSDAQARAASVVSKDPELKGYFVGRMTRGTAS